MCISYFKICRYISYLKIHTCIYTHHTWIHDICNLFYIRAHRNHMYFTPYWECDTFLHNLLQHTATYRLQHTATNCNGMQRAATHCSTLLLMFSMEILFLFFHKHQQYQTTARWSHIKTKNKNNYQPKKKLRILNPKPWILTLETCGLVLWFFGFIFVAPRDQRTVLYCWWLDFKVFVYFSLFIGVVIFCFVCDHRTTVSHCWSSV